MTTSQIILLCITCTVIGAFMGFLMAVLCVAARQTSKELEEFNEFGEP